ncbi:MAG: colanic acid biosynthesis protein [Anaerosporomusa subterranea]|jgi:polysaccharide pyruvyl transferase CsaB|nr:colanic acid biosynthesis protein [Anaerosporomusa subterranea]
MSKIVISGYYGFGNAGDEAMLAAMIGSFRRLEPTAEFTVLSGNPAETESRHGVKAVYRMNALDILRAIAGCNLLVSGGGSLLQTVTSERSLYYYLSVMLMGKTFGKPVMIYAQGVGPVRGAAARNAVRCIGNKLDLITVRDEGSLLELKSIGVSQPPVYVTADPVLSLPPSDGAFGRKVLRQYGLDQGGPVIGISVREWKDMAHYKKVFAGVADQLAAKGARLVFIPMQKPDVEAATRIVAYMRQPAVVLTEEYRTDELLSLMGNLDMLIGIRLHALIFAAVMNVPLIGVSYDPKIERFLESIGQSAVGTLNDITVNGLLNQVQTVLSQASDERRPHDQVKELRQQAFRSAELAVGLMLRKAKHKL